MNEKKLHVLELFVREVPREEIPNDAKWFMQDGGSAGLLKSSHYEPLKVTGSGLCVDGSYFWERRISIGRISIKGNREFSSHEEACDSSSTLITREELMRAYDLVEQGYTLWFGGECPVPTGTIIDVEYRTLSGVSNIPAGVYFRGAGRHFWIRGWRDLIDGVNDDIIAYRLSKPAQPVVDKAILAHIEKSGSTDFPSEGEYLLINDKGEVFDEPSDKRVVSKVDWQRVVDAMPVKYIPAVGEEFYINYQNDGGKRHGRMKCLASNATGVAFEYIEGDHAGYMDVARQQVTDFIRADDEELPF